MLITNLIANMVIVSALGVIQTNTPEFREFELQMLLSNAQVTAIKWHLDSSLINTNKITDFWVQPLVDGAHAHIVFAGRYVFARSLGRFLEKYDGSLIFADTFYCWPDYSFIDYDPNYTGEKAVEKTQSWLRATNLLTMEKAQQIADSAVRSIDIPTGKALSEEPTTKEQKMWMLLGGKPCLEPYYIFDWKPEKGRCKIDVSGVNGNIVYFNYSDDTHFKLPTNYYKMLGLSTNTVFVTPAISYQHGPPYKIFNLDVP